MGELAKDSIRRELEDAVCYDIDNMRLLLAEDFRHTKGFVFLEGPDDVKFFRRQLSDVAIGIEYYGTGGKHGIEKALADESMKDDRVIGICDRDYSEEQADRIFYCDKCCLELMVISENEVWHKFCDLYYNGEEHYTSVLSGILRQLAPVSMLRKENAQKNAGIEEVDFRKLKLGKYLDVHNIDICQAFTDCGWKGYYEHCLRLAANLTDEELYEYTNGHDLCKILGMICEGGKGPLGEKKVRDILYKKYERRNFVKTDLYNDLKQYQNQENRTWKYVD